MKNLSLPNLKIKLFADGADKKNMIKFSKIKNIAGLTTNPSLMKKSGIKDYKKFALEVLNKIKNKPISFEVFSDDLNEMYKQAKVINSWGKNVYVKIPVTNTKGRATYKLISKLTSEGIKLNVTAILTLNQVEKVINSVKSDTKVIVSIFSGRIADTGIDPENIIKKAVFKTKRKKNIMILWASTREVFNIFQAIKCKCHIITVPFDLLKKLKFYKYNLKKYSLETVKTFYTDARKAGYNIRV